MGTPHKVLGVSKNASREEIRSAYRRLALASHPDRFPGDRLARGRWQEIQEAHEYYKKLWAKADGVPAGGTSAAPAEEPERPAVASETVNQVKDLSRPFATGIVGIMADFLKNTLAGKLPGGVAAEIAGKAGQAAIDEAAVRARAKLDDVLKRG